MKELGYLVAPQLSAFFLAYGPATWVVDGREVHMVRLNNTETLLGRIKACMGCLLKWDPAPVDPPKLPENFDYLSAPGKIIACIRYRLAQLEFVLAPNGQVREWRRCCVRIAYVVCLAGLVIVPLCYVLDAVVTLVTHIFECLLILGAITGILVFISKQRK
jgi:hypothetical protein